MAHAMWRTCWKNSPHMICPHMSPHDMYADSKQALIPGDKYKALCEIAYLWNHFRGGQKVRTATVPCGCQQVHNENYDPNTINKNLGHGQWWRRNFFQKTVLFVFPSNLTKQCLFEVKEKHPLNFFSERLQKRPKIKTWTKNWQRIDTQRFNTHTTSRNDKMISALWHFHAQLSKDNPNFSTKKNPKKKIKNGHLKKNRRCVVAKNTCVPKKK